MAQPSQPSEYPVSLEIAIPLPTARLASIALQSLRVDPELSSLVRRTLFVATAADADADAAVDDEASKTVLRARYEATTNRMLRVAVNSFMDSLALVLEVMEELDADVLSAASAGAKDATGGA